MAASIDFARLELMDALDLAILIEVEALKRYELFTDLLGDTDAGRVFASMVLNETKHASELTARREALFGDAALRVNASQLSDVEAPDAGAPRSNMSPLRAYEVALGAERKAHAFYNDALAYVNDEGIRSLFRELRDEEAEHVRMVEQAIAHLPSGSEVDLLEEDETPAL